MTAATLSVSPKKAKKKSTEDYKGELFLTPQEGVPECRTDTVMLLYGMRIWHSVLRSFLFSLLLLTMMAITLDSGILSSFYITSTYIPFSPRGGVPIHAHLGQRNELNKCVFNHWIC